MGFIPSPPVGLGEKMDPLQGGFGRLWLNRPPEENRWYPIAPFHALDRWLGRVFKTATGWEKSENIYVSELNERKRKKREKKRKKL